MLIKFHMDDADAERLKQALSFNVASKAALEAASTYLDQLNMIARLERENMSLLERLRVAEQTISRARGAAALLLDYVAQPDLLEVDRV